MSFKKVILSIALGISFHGAIMSMEKEISEQINLINLFAKHSLGQQAHEIEPFCHWLTEKRNEFREDNKWDSLIDNLLGSISINDKNNWKNANKHAIRDVIEKTVRPLKPGKDCAEQLANDFTKAVKEASDKWAKANDFEVYFIC
jgi:hypothetical protein